MSQNSIGHNSRMRHESATRDGSGIGIATLAGLMGLGILLWPSLVTGLIGQATGFVTERFGTLVLWFSTGLLVLGAALAVLPTGRYRLANDDAPPEFSRAAWLAMLFAAGMGSGLIFWGVAEPLTHRDMLLETGFDEAAASARSMALTWFHWGLHAWAIYALSALAIAWFHYRRGAKETPSGGIEHWAGRRLGSASVTGIGRTADALAILAVLFGVAGALANSITLLFVGFGDTMGAGAEPGGFYAIVLALLGAAFLASVTTGIHGGIRWLSTLNVWLALALLTALAWFLQPGAFVALSADALTTWVTSLPRWSVELVSVEGSHDWARGWTVTYLLWWMAWTPFVGLFIARISRGRTVREFIAGVVLVPVAVSMVWFAVLGGGAIEADRASGGAVSATLAQHYTAPLFAWLSTLPIGGILAGTCGVLLFVFMVTSADSACYVLGMLGRRGEPRPPVSARIGWGLLLIALTAGLLVRDDVDVNKAVAIAGAIPFLLILAAQVVALMLDLRRDG